MQVNDIAIVQNGGCTDRPVNIYFGDEHRRPSWYDLRTDINLPRQSFANKQGWK